jgi:hypothetical protein
MAHEIVRKLGLTRTYSQIATTLQGVTKRSSIAPHGEVACTIKLYLNSVLGSDLETVSRLDEYAKLWSLLHWYVSVCLYIYVCVCLIVYLIRGWECLNVM